MKTPWGVVDNIRPITVAELIRFLQQQPGDMPILYKCCSEQVELELDDILFIEACAPRSDGWVQNKRPDMPSQSYLLFPGN